MVRIKIIGVQPLTTRRPRIVYLAVGLLAAMAVTGHAQVRIDPETWVQEAEDAYGQVTNYTGIFHKQQLFEEKLLPEETMFIKFRNPFSLYMRWGEEPHKGSELLYVAGWNNNLARVHRGGLLRLITRNLPTGDPLLMSHNLRPLTDTGVGFLVKTVAANVRKAIQAGELGFYERGEETVYGRKTRRLEIVFSEVKAKGYDAFRLMINQDMESKILIKIQMYDWENRLFEHYGYEQLQLDPGLTDADFDPENPDYHF